MKLKKTEKKPLSTPTNYFPVLLGSKCVWCGKIHLTALSALPCINRVDNPRKDDPSPSFFKVKDLKAPVKKMEVGVQGMELILKSEQEGLKFLTALFRSLSKANPKTEIYGLLRRVVERWVPIMEENFNMEFSLEGGDWRSIYPKQ